jgi:hypothetical protein
MNYVSQQRRDDDDLIRKVADYEKISAALWLVLGIIQILCVVTAIAGIWNVIAAISRFKLAERIREGDAGVVDSYESMAGLVVIGVVNLFFGAVFGLLFVGFDFYIRDLVLTNREIFSGGVSRLARPQPITARDVETLERLATLRDSGVLTEQEFQAQKGQIIA